MEQDSKMTSGSEELLNYLIVVIIGSGRWVFYNAGQPAAMKVS